MVRPSVIVVGLGAVGSATALHLARAGAQVLGLDRWQPPHTMGSTHGESRITRVTAWEGAQYVPLVQRANALWASFAAETGATYGHWRGGLFVGRPEDYHVAGTLASARAAGVPCEALDAAAIAARWPELRVPDGMVGAFDPGAGLLYPERIVADQLAAAREAGATLAFDAEVLEYGPYGSGVFVRTAATTHRADRLVLCTGAWMPEVLAPLGHALLAERVTLQWFEALGPALHRRPESAPVLLVGDGHGHATAIFPTMGGRVKAAGHGSDEFTTADAVDRAPRASDVLPVQAILERVLPGHVGAHVKGAVCLYTRTSTGDFLLDRHPQYPQVILGSACNGFGFKFSVASGEILAALALDAIPPVDPAPWRLPSAPMPQR